MQFIYIINTKVKEQVCSCIYVINTKVKEQVCSCIYHKH